VSGREVRNRRGRTTKLSLLGSFCKQQLDAFLHAANVVIPTNLMVPIDFNLPMLWYEGVRNVSGRDWPAENACEYGGRPNWVYALSCDMCC
jgi:hypothetical protein